MCKNICIFDFSFLNLPQLMGISFQISLQKHEHYFNTVFLTTLNL